MGKGRRVAGGGDESDRQTRGEMEGKGEVKGAGREEEMAEIEREGGERRSKRD